MRHTPLSRMVGFYCLDFFGSNFVCCYLNDFCYFASSLKDEIGHLKCIKTSQLKLIANSFFITTWELFMNKSDFGIVKTYSCPYQKCFVKIINCLLGPEVLSRNTQ